MNRQFKDAEQLNSYESIQCSQEYGKLSAFPAYFIYRSKPLSFGTKLALRYTVEIILRGRY